MTLEERIARLEADVSQLRALVDTLYAHGAGTFFPRLPSLIENRCTACGLNLEGVMGYVCARQPCPVGMGGPTC